MQQSPLLQPFTSAIDYSPKKSKAESEASQRDHLKPSQCQVGDTFYRYEAHMVSRGVDEWDESLGSYLSLYCLEYMVLKVTDKGVRLVHDDLCGKPVLDRTINKFAYPSKAEALLGFIARKRRQQSILLGQLARSREAQYKAEQLLAKELE